jgi:hypothetical protein
MSKENLEHNTQQPKGTMPGIKQQLRRYQGRGDS